MMPQTLTEQDILDVFLESDTEEDNIEDEQQTLSIQNLNDLDLEICFGTESRKCVNTPGKKIVDLQSIFPTVTKEETQRGYMERQVGDYSSLRHVCLDCGKHYAHKITLITHRNQIHLGKYLHTCKLCQKNFGGKREYEDHVRRHTGERPFTCPGCKMCYGSSTSFRHHKKRCRQLKL